MSTKGSMRTRSGPLVQDQNLSINYKGGDAKVPTDGSKAEQNQKAGLGVRKPLANITNSEKPSVHLESKKNEFKKCANREATEEEPKPKQKAGLGARKALANIRNSEKPSLHQEPAKNVLKKCTNREAAIAIKEEQCQHNHRSCCITQNLLKTILPLDDGKSPMELWSPNTPSTLNQPKVDLVTTPRYLEFTQSPVSLKVRSSICRSMHWSPFSPSMC